MAGELTIILFVAFFVLAGGPVLADRLLDLWGYHPKARERAALALLALGPAPGVPAQGLSGVAVRPHSALAV